MSTTSSTGRGHITHDMNCGVCSTVAVDNFLVCHGACGRCFHYLCVNLTKEALKVIDKFESIH